VLPSLDAIDHSKLDSEAKIAAVSETVSLRLRDLRGAVLIDARLRKADFTATNLRDALLDRANLQEAKFDCAQSKLNEPLVPQTDCAQLQGASLNYAQLQNASLEAYPVDSGPSICSRRGAGDRPARLRGLSRLNVPISGGLVVGGEPEQRFKRNMAIEATIVAKHEFVEIRVNVFAT
jgi:Pentapeptide repeats (8 copies)